MEVQRLQGLQMNKKSRRIMCARGEVALLVYHCILCRVCCFVAVVVLVVILVVVVVAVVVVVVVADAVVL